MGEGVGDAVDEVGLPGDQDARPGGVLGLADEVGGDEPGVGGPVGDQDDLARAGDAVDVDLAVDLPLGQGDEEVPRADDLVDRLDPVDPVGEQGDGLGAADPVDLGDPQGMAGGEEVGVLPAGLGPRRAR